VARPLGVVAYGEAMGWANYVALGDSLTAGRDDHGPGGARIGWARRLAGILTGGYGQFISVTTAERYALIIGLGMSGLGFYLGMAFGGFV